jgi:hypothetical protein
LGEIKGIVVLVTPGMTTPDNRAAAKFASPK